MDDPASCDFPTTAAADTSRHTGFFRYHERYDLKYLDGGKGNLAGNRQQKQLAMDSSLFIDKIPETGAISGEIHPALAQLRTLKFTNRKSSISATCPSLREGSSESPVMSPSAA